MAIYKVDTPDGKIIQVSAPDDATDEQIIELAKKQEAATKDADQPESDLTQSRILGTGAGIVNAVGPSVPGAIASSIRAVRNIGQPEPQVTNTARGAAAASNLGKFAAKAIGPYGAITSADDASQRFQNARGPIDYLQSGISGVGAAGYGMSSLGNMFPPAKIPGMVVGGAADLANMGIDAVNQYVRRLALQRAQQQ
jgi:hypothetical protein